MKITKFYLLFMISISFYVSAALHATYASASDGVYSFQGGNCSFFGDWTSSALATANDVKRYIRQLKDNPMCAGIEKLVTDIAMPVYEKNDITVGNQKRYESLNGEISSLTELLKTDSGLNGKLFNILLGRTLENHKLGIKSNISERSSKTLNYGLSLLDNVLAQLPNFDECLANEPNVTLSLFGGMTKMLASFAGSGEGGLSRMGNTIFNFVRFLQNKKFSRIIRKLSQSEYWVNLSCLLETASENYCSVKDAYEMLSYSKKESKIISKKNGEEITYNPLEGYFILTREVPIVSSWLQKVMFGVRPRTLADAQYKNKVIDNVNEFLQDENSLISIYSDAVLKFAGLTNKTARQNHVLEVVKTLTQMMTGGNFGGGARRGDVNFFSWAVLPAKVPFQLIGRNSIPPECASNDKGGFVMPYPLYLENGGNYQPEFNDPAILLASVGVELERMISLAREQASSYYQQLLIVDRANLVDQSLTSQTITVYSAFQRIEKYLNKLATRIEESRTPEDLALLPNLLNTISRIKKILGIYKKLQEKTKEYLETYSPDEVDEEIINDPEFTKILEEIVATVYTSFNVILQRDTFLTTRLETFVRYDYAQHTRNATNLSEYQQNLMVVTGKNLIDRLLNTAYGKNPAMIRQDLAAAQVINMRTLAALERLFGHGIHPIISEVKLVSDGKGDSGWNKNVDSLKRMGLDAVGYYMWDITKNYGYLQVISSPLNFVGHFIWRMDRYPFEWIDWNEIITEHDDEYGSYNQFKARLCMQTLAFKKNEEFYSICEGSFLRAHDFQSDYQANLDVYYDNMLKDHFAAKRVWEKEGNPDQKAVNLDILQKKNDENICALRNFRRKNYAYWLLKQVASDNK